MPWSVNPKQKSFLIFYCSMCREDAYGDDHGDEDNDGDNADNGGFTTHSESVSYRRTTILPEEL